MTTHHLDVAEPGQLERAFKITLWLFIGTMVFSIAGMLLLRLVPASMQYFGPYYAQLIKGPTWTYMALLPVLPVLMYWRSLGWKLMLFFVACGSLVGAASELIGTTTGFPFGMYTYTEMLGPKILAHVPYFIPLSWFAMSVVSLDLAGRLVPSRWQRIVLAALLMVAWDVSLDPAMGTFAQTTFWYYGVEGFYYGMPFSNWLGWFGVSLIIGMGYEFIGGGLPETSRWAPLVWALNCIFPLVLCLMYGLYAAFLAGILATALPLLALRARHRRLNLAPAAV